MMRAERKRSRRLLRGFLNLNLTRAIPRIPTSRKRQSSHSLKLASMKAIVGAAIWSAVLGLVQGAEFYNNATYITYSPDVQFSALRLGDSRIHKQPFELQCTPPNFAGPCAVHINGNLTGNVYAYRLGDGILYQPPGGMNSMRRAFIAPTGQVFVGYPSDSIVSNAWSFKGNISTSFYVQFEGVENFAVCPDDADPKQLNVSPPLDPN